MADVVLNALKKVGDIADDNIRAIGQAMEALEKNLLADFGSLTLTQGVDIAVLRSQIEQYMVQNGYYEVVDSLVNEKFQELIDISHKKYLDLYDESLQFAPESLEALSTLKQSIFVDFAGVGETFTKDISKTIINLQLGAVTKKDAIEQISKITNKTLGQSKTLIDTSTFGYYQDVTNKMAEDNGFEVYVPVGPVDNKIRDFCLDMLTYPQPKTKDEIMALNNGQGLPVMSYFGGYNCRHTWEPVRGEAGKEYKKTQAISDEKREQIKKNRAVIERQKAKERYARQKELDRKQSVG